MGQKSQGLEQKLPFPGQLSFQAWRWVKPVCYLGNYSKAPKRMDYKNKSSVWGRIIVVLQIVSLGGLLGIQFLMKTDLATVWLGA